MIKFDILNITTTSYLDDIKLPGINFKSNKNNKYNDLSNDGIITYIGESSIFIKNDTNKKSTLRKTKDKKDNDTNEEKTITSTLTRLTFLSSDVEKLRERLKEKFREKNIKLGTIKYESRLNKLKIPEKNKFKYFTIKPFKSKELEFCFREINSSTDLIDYQMNMKPNSAESDITGICEIKIYLDINKDELKNLMNIFDDSYLSGDEFSSEIYQNETLTIIASNENRCEISLEVRGKVFKGKKVNITSTTNKNDKDNNQENTIIFLY